MLAREHEHTLNVWLAAALRKYGLAARAEQIQPGNRRIDVEVRIGPVVVALEAEHGQSPNKQASAIRDADARLKQGLAQCALAVCYPDNTTEESLPTAKLLWSVREPSVAYSSAWHDGDVEQLATVLRLLPAQLGDPDVLAAVLSASLDGAVARLSESQKQDLALTLDLPESTKGNPLDTAAKRALLVIVSAVMFHARLDTHLRGMKEEEMHSTVAAWPPAKAPVCAEAADPIAAFSEAWTLILRLDYKPIFETALAALSSCSHDLALTDAIRESARAALAVVRNIAGLRHDLLGRIFHTVLDSARYDGSFYTTTPAATLLATLAIADDMCDWQDPEAIARLRITDPACGTGTLLMAAAERIRDLAPKGQDEAMVSTSLIEEVLCGYDVNLTATHMAATTLGLLSPTTLFRQMKIGRAFLGVDHLGVAYLGSLEFLDRQPYLVPWPQAAQAVSQIDSGEEIVQAEPADLVIMNPPYTRDSLRHDQFTSAEESKLKAREKELFANTPVRLSHNGSTFLYLADFLAKEDVGTVAVVLPLVGATNYSTLDIRKYLANRYHIETIVTSHDPQRIYFSENTSIGEMLLICRHWPDGKADTAKPATRVVNLAINPATPATAISVAHAITNAGIGDYGTLQEWPAEKIAAGDWGAVQFLSPYLCAKFADIKSQQLFPSIPIREIADIGPAGQGIRGVFLRSKMPDEHGRMALWQHNTQRTQSMATTADTHIIAKPQKEHLAESYWSQRGTLLLPTRIRLNTGRVISVRLDTPALGSLWVPCRLHVSRDCLLEWEKALCIYLNSSIGVLAILGDRTNKTPSYPQLSLDDLRKLVVPDFATIGRDAAPVLTAVYDAHAEDTLLPLPQMNDCPVRRALDEAVIATLGLDGEMVATIRRSLAMEPSVTGRRYGV